MIGVKEDEIPRRISDTTTALQELAIYVLNRAAEIAQISVADVLVSGTEAGIIMKDTALALAANVGKHFDGDKDFFARLNDGLDIDWEDEDADAENS